MQRADEPPYRPIDCGYHDHLLALATLRRACEVVYSDGEGEPRTTEGRIVDVFSRGGAEFLTLDDGTEVRLDRLVRVAGVERPG